jgi:iron complex outermembrane receptor protein
MGYLQIAATLYDNQQEIPDGSRDSLSRRFTKQVSEDDDIKNRPLVTDDELSTYKIAPLKQSIKHYRLYAQTQFKVGEGSINLLTGLQQNIRREFLHPSDAGQASLDIILNTLNYEARYNLPVFSGFETTIGANGFYQTNRNQDATTFPIPDYNLFDIGTYIFAKKHLERWMFRAAYGMITAILTGITFMWALMRKQVLAAGKCRNAGCRATVPGV